MKKRLTVIAAVLIILVMTGLIIGNPVVTYHNFRLKNAITKIDSESVMLNEVVPFQWDKVYTFAPYTSQEEIEKVLGFKSNSIHETVNEGMVQLLFVKGDSLTASVCGYEKKLGYRIEFTDCITYEENAKCLVDKSSGIVVLTKQ